MASPFLKAAQAAVKAAGSVGATKDVVLRRTIKGDLDPGTGETGEDTVTNYPWTVVMTEYAQGLVDGTNVVRGDRKMLGAAADLAVTPTPTTDKLIVDGDTYNIVEGGVRRDPADATWEVQVRK